MSTRFGLESVQRPGPRRSGQTRWTRLTLLAAFALVLFAAAMLMPRPAHGALTDEDCFACHTDRSLTSSDGSRRSLYVDPDAHRKSVHGGFACARCHTDARSIPHASKLTTVGCVSCHGREAAAVSKSAHAGADGSSAGCVGCHGSAHTIKRGDAVAARDACRLCHERETEDFAASVHGVARASGDLEAAACGDCHGASHGILVHTDPAAPTSRDRLAGTCARCHADRQLVTRRHIAIPEAIALYARSVHGRSDKPEAARCNDCHESHRLRRPNDPTSSINHARIAETCGRCHAREARDYGISIHAQAVARGARGAPICIDCHGEHLIRGPRDPGSPVEASAVTATCSHCHEAEGIRETYGLPAGRLSTYQESYHGLAARGGAPAVANCASCHRWHDVLPSSDPRSSVSPERLPETCGACHPGAGPRFAAGRVHVAMSNADHPVLFWVRWIYLLLIFVTIGGMLLHNGLDFGTKVRAHWRAKSGAVTAGEAGVAGATPAAPDEAHAAGPARWFERMTVFERFQHVLLALSFFVLVFTGFALKFPEAWPFAWLARLEQGAAWRSVVHRVAAVVMVVVSLMHVVYLLTARGRGFLAAMAPGLRDAREALGNVLHMVGLRRERPAFDRFSYVEKAEYWALIWGTVVMTVTGFVLWFENQSLRALDKWMLDLATIVHYCEAWLAFLAIVVWHLYATMVNPDVYPMNWTWVTGKISEADLKHEHRAEWEQIVAAERAAADAAADDPGEGPTPR